MPAIENEGQLIKRFQMMEASSQKHTKKKKKSWNIGLIVTLAIIFLSSYLFIFEAHYMSPEVAESTVALTDENGYAVKKEDGSYDVYYKGYFLENTEKLTYYDPDMPVYTEADAPAPLN